MVVLTEDEKKLKITVKDHTLCKNYFFFFPLTNFLEMETQPPATEITIKKKQTKKMKVEPTKSSETNTGRLLKKQLFTKIATETAKTAFNNTYRFNPAVWAMIDGEDAISFMFSKFCTHMDGEIEAKLGRWIDNQFVSGVSQHDFDQIVSMLASYTKWSNTKTCGQWVTIVDYILTDNIRVSKTSAGNEFVRKVLMDNVTLRCAERPYHVRVSLKRETKVEVQLPKEPIFVRVKRRRSFVYKDTWCFDCSCVWSGRDEQDAQSRPPVYEVECEFVAKEATVSRTLIQQKSKYFALNMLEKVKDLLQRKDGADMTFTVQHTTFPAPNEAMK